MGYARAVLFPRARDAFRHYMEVCGVSPPLPVCICPEMATLSPDSLMDVDWTGLHPGTQMYGYRSHHTEDLDLDPLITGWFREPSSEHRIISLGRHKILPLTGGGVFCTNNLDLADELAERSFFPGGEVYAEKVQTVFSRMEEVVHNRFILIDLWDRYLGDMLERIPREQVMPWRVMRQCPGPQRPAVIKALRMAGIAVSVNYQPSPLARGDRYYPNAMKWGDTVINFPIGSGLENVAESGYERYVFRAAATIFGALHTNERPNLPANSG